MMAALLRLADERIEVEARHSELAASLSAAGLGAFDALHVAVAELSGCDLLLTTDDELIRRAVRVRPALRVRVVNPAVWVLEEAPNGS